jgi:hypothetical protein
MPVTVTRSASRKQSYRTPGSTAEVLRPRYNKPFDVFANGGKTGDWLLR